MESDRMSYILYISAGMMTRCAYSLSKKHKEHPWGMDVNGEHYEVNYWPGDSMSGMFGGNSNWRGPICECDTCHLWLSPLTRLLPKGLP